MMAQDAVPFSGGTRECSSCGCYTPTGFWSVIIKVKSPNARKGDKIITLRRDSKWENGIQARNAGRR